MMRRVVALVLSASLQYCVAECLVPDGFRKPDQRDMVSVWQENKADYPTPYHISQDFNSDGLVDDARILIKTKGKGFGLFVCISNPDSGYSFVVLDEDTVGKAQVMGISAVRPGSYETACGKGYWDCDKGEPAVLDLKAPAINYFHFESANSFFIWNKTKNKFTRVWMSD